MLAYYVGWHMREARRELLFSDEDQHVKQVRDPVAPAVRSAKALRKVHTHRLDDGSEVESFRTRLRGLSTIVRNVCRRKQASVDEPTFAITTIPSPKQQRTLDLIDTITL